VLRQSVENWVKVMRLTEILHFINTETVSQTWMRTHYSHFDPTMDDDAARKNYRKALRKEEKDKEKPKQKYKIVEYED